jgi:hypothetical protein
MENIYIRLSQFFDIPACMSEVTFRAFLPCPDYINTPFKVGTETLARILFIRQPMSFDESLELSKKLLNGVQIWRVGW